MKRQTQHIENNGHVFDYSLFGAPLDGRTLQNTFYQEEFTTDTITETAYALEETFATSSNWSTTTSNSQISYPLSKMRVKNNASTKKTIGTRKSFTTGSGLHQLGNPGETVLRVNTYRKQLGLAQRRTYEAMGGKVLFSEPYKDKRGKEQVRYFTLPAFNK